MSRELPGITQNEINENFRQCLSAAIDLGQYSGTDLGLTRPVMDAIDAVAESYPDIDERLIQKAKRVFASQPKIGERPKPDPAFSEGFMAAYRRRTR